MSTPYFKTWFGKNSRIVENHNETRFLILSESAYSWIDDNQKIWHPSPLHPKGSLIHWVKHLDQKTYFSSMSKALCRRETPTTEQAMQEWNECAYTIYVQKTVGLGARSRPSSQQWKEAKYHFLSLIENIRPLKVLVTGLDMWNRRMPGCNGPHYSDTLQAYRLSDGVLVWCLALAHPSNRTTGFRWKEVGEDIRLFRSARLPRRRVGICDVVRI